MKKRIDLALNILMGVSLGTFAGRSLYICLDFHARPNMYATGSAPWYAGILVSGVLTSAVLAACLAGKALIRKKEDQP